MKMKAIIPFVIIFSMLVSTFVAAQDTEFSGGYTLHAKLHNGVSTNFHRGADLYVGGLQLIPQIAVAPGKLRIGAVAGVFYSGQKLEGQLGPTISVKLKTINAGPFGSAANVHLTADHLWGTGKQKLAGGGFHVDLLNKIVLGLTAHRDYEFKSWWLQTALGLRLSKIKKTTEPFNE
ncbi:MAG: hypothetical protein EOO03_01175 [Chitinophagaceae bacterium]|nr:MAG: hypothetical protein EOO03_01175 [Chitinophagaceae bacterium]